VSPRPFRWLVTGWGDWLAIVITQTRLIMASPATVFAVLSDGWLFASWVVGAARIRDVDADWPAADSRIHHSVGSWPLMLSDQTIVSEMKPNSVLEMIARAWPAGEALVRIELEAHGAGTNVVMHEDARRGPATLIPGPVREIALKRRNAESLKRLAYLAENGARKAPSEV
jgi:uncharacterized protein YndB with AHSA1/START domain